MLHKSLTKILFVFILFFLAHMTYASVIYVNHDAHGKNNGSHWRDAYTDLQQALSGAQKGDVIWVRQGVYYPSENIAEGSFVLGDRVIVLGGFLGNETYANQRDFIKNKTILNGDIKKNGNKDDFSKHVVIMGSFSVLDGFVVENGYTKPIFPQAAIDKKMNSKPQTHTTPQEIMQHAKDGSGAGILMFNHGGIVKNTIIRNNEAFKGAGAYNMVHRPHETPVYINDTFLNNTAILRGGGISNDLQTNPIIINCKFIYNHCDHNTCKGGAIYNDFGASPIILNSVIKYNTAQRAASMGSDGSSHPILVNATIINNTAISLGAALYQGSYNANIPNGNNTTTLINSTVKNNKSLTNGPNILIWGDNVYAFYNSVVENWPWKISSTIPPKYQPLVVQAKQWLLKKTDTIVDPRKFDIRKLTFYLPKQKGKPSVSPKKIVFKDAQAVVHKTLDIPDSIFYVNVNNQNSQSDGKSWKTAWRNLQRAIDQVSQTGGGKIWIAKGIYYPDITKVDANKSTSFTLKPNVALYGGFNGDETKFNMRNINKNKTILSGYSEIKSKHYVQSYHVVIGSQPSLLDGLTIENGSASGIGNNAYGGGLLMIGYKQSTNLNHVTFVKNQAYYGGAIYAFNNVMSYMNHVTLKNNKAMLGGGMYISFGSDLQFNNGIINNNHAQYRGAGIVVNYGSNPIFNATEFTNNFTTGNGGAIWIDDQSSQFGGTSPSFIGCKFSKNQAAYLGANYSADTKSTPIWKNNH